MAKERRKLTGEQRKILDEADANITRAYQDAREKLSAAGWPEPTNESTECLVCDCEEFLPAHGIHRCARPRCGHSIIRHVGFI